MTTEEKKNVQAWNAETPAEMLQVIERQLTKIKVAQQEIETLIASSTEVSRHYAERLAQNADERAKMEEQFETTEKHLRAEAGAKLGTLLAKINEAKGRIENEREFYRRMRARLDEMLPPVVQVT